VTRIFPAWASAHGLAIAAQRALLHPTGHLELQRRPAPIIETMASSKLDSVAVQEGLRLTLEEPKQREVFNTINRIQTELEAEPKDEGDEPKSKKRMTVIHPENSTEVAWIIAHDDEIPPAGVSERLNLAIADYNASRRGRLAPARNLFDGLDRCPAKTFLSYGVSVRTKESIALLAINSDLKQPVQADA